MLTLSRGLRILVLSLGVVISPFVVPGGYKIGHAAVEKAGKTASTDISADIDRLIRNLSDPAYRVRIEASRSLLKLGLPAIVPLTKAAQTTDLDLAARCLSILKVHFHAKDVATKSAAKKALRELAGSKHKSVASRAAEATRKPKPVPTRNRLGNRIVFGNGGARIQVRFLPQNGKRIAIRVPRKVQRQANVTEKGKTIQITETLAPKREIVVKVTEKMNGKKKTTEYKARSSIELKKKHPAAYQLYRKHIRNARVRVQFGGAGLKNIVVPPVVVRARGRNLRMSSRTINGVRTMDIQDGGKSIKITDEKGRNITVRVTETVKGKAKTSEYKAKDLKELKTKSPAAAKLYEKYTKRANFGFNAFGGFGRGGIRIPGQFLPRQAFPFGRIVGGANVQNAKKEIEKANKRLAVAIEKLKNLAAAKNAQPADLKKLAVEIQVAREDLERAFNALGK